MDRIYRLKKRAVSLIALFLLAALTSFAGQVITISDGGDEYRLLLQYIPALAVGAAAVFILYYGGMLRECCLGSAPVYGLIGSAVTLVWALCSGNQTMPFFSLLAKSPAALFAQSEYRYADGRACLTPAPYAGCLTTAVAGAARRSDDSSVRSLSSVWTAAWLLFRAEELFRFQVAVCFDPGGGRCDVVCRRMGLWGLGNRLAPPNRPCFDIFFRRVFRLCDGGFSSHIVCQTIKRRQGQYSIYDEKTCA